MLYSPVLVLVGQTPTFAAVSCPSVERLYERDLRHCLSFGLLTPEQCSGHRETQRRNWYGIPRPCPGGTEKPAGPKTAPKSQPKKVSPNQASPKPPQKKQTESKKITDMSQEEREATFRDLTAQAAHDNRLNPWDEDLHPRKRRDIIVGDAKPQKRQQGNDIDPKTGQPCVSVISKGEKSFASGWKSYEYLVTNTCSKNFYVTLDTNAGYSGAIGVGANDSSKWSCADGLKHQRSCKGLRSYSYR